MDYKKQLSKFKDICQEKHVGFLNGLSCEDCPECKVLNAFSSYLNELEIEEQDAMADYFRKQDKECKHIYTVCNLHPSPDCPACKLKPRIELLDFALRFGSGNMSAIDTFYQRKINEIIDFINQI